MRFRQFFPISNAAPASSMAAVVEKTMLNEAMTVVTTIPKINMATRISRSVNPSACGRWILETSNA